MKHHKHKKQPTANQQQNQFFVNTKDKKSVKMDSNTKRLMVSVDPAKRAMWKRLMLNAQWHMEDFERHKIIATVRTNEGGHFDAVVDARFQKRAKK